MKPFDGTGRALRAALLLAGVLAAANPAAAETLAETLAQAYRNSPLLRAARLDVVIAAESAAQARAGGRPTLTGTATATANLVRYNDGRFPTSLSLRATQSLYSGGQVENATLAAETRITAAEANYLGQEQRLLFAAVRAYMNMIRDTRFVSLSQNNVRVLNEQLLAARARFAVGDVTRTDVAQAEARFAAAQSTLAAQRGALETSRQNFLRVVGREPVALEAPPPLPDLPATRDDALAIAYRLAPGVAAARLEADASGIDVRAAIGALLPQLDLVAEIRRDQTFSRARVSNAPRNEALLGLSLTVPIFSGGGNYSRVREAQARAERATVGINDQIRTVVESVSNAWSDLQVARAAIRAGQLEVRSAQLAFDGVREEASLGARTTLDVLDSEQELLTARADLAAVRRDEQVAAYDLLSAMGLLTLEHLGLAATRDDGSDYYGTVDDRLFGYDASDETVWSFPYRP